MKTALIVALGVCVPLLSGCATKLKEPSTQEETLQDALPSSQGWRVLRVVTRPTA